MLVFFLKFNTEEEINFSKTNLALSSELNMKTYV